MKIIIRIGGSILGIPFNSLLIGKYVDLLKTLKDEGNEVVAVVGGGSLAREFIKVIAEIGLKESSQDWAAIHVSRVYAHLLLIALNEAHPSHVPISIDEIDNLLKKGRIVIMGGLYPGMTTDSVAALVGERIKADLLVKGSNVDGIYTKDPRKYSDSKKIDRIRFEELTDIFEAKTHKAGINQILDPKAVKIIQSYRLKTVVVDGFNPDNILAAVRGNCIGTVIE